MAPRGAENCAQDDNGIEYVEMDPPPPTQILTWIFILAHPTRYFIKCPNNGSTGIWLGLCPLWYITGYKIKQRSTRKQETTGKIGRKGSWMVKGRPPLNINNLGGPDDFNCRDRNHSFCVSGREGTS